MATPPPSYPEFGLDSQPGDELVDIVFVIDGSGSIATGCWGPFQLQKKAIINTFTGPYGFIPHDGTVAIAVIQFGFSDYPYTYEHVPLTVIDDLATANALVAEVDAISQSGGGTPLAAGLDKALDIFQFEAINLSSKRFVVVSTDGGVQYPDVCLSKAEHIRTGIDPLPPGDPNRRPDLPPARICSLLVGVPCLSPPQSTPECFLRQIANTQDWGVMCSTQPGPPYPNQIIGTFNCAQDLANPAPDGAIPEFVELCDRCSCAWVHASEPDCDGNGIPDCCDHDCNGNVTSDACEIQADPSLDCNENGIPDTCELPNGVPGGPFYCEEPVDVDCNENAVPDECDIADGMSPDFNGNGIPDECEGALHVDLDAPGPRDGT